MPAALIVPISGPYVGTVEAFPLGVQNDDGYELECTLQGQEIRESDAFGMTLVEAIYRGMNWKCRFRGLEWNKEGLLFVLQQFATNQDLNILQPDLGHIGQRWSTNGQTLLLTAILGNPPTYPQTLTALLASFSPNSTTAFNMTSKLREMPLEMVLLPYAASITGGTFNIPFSTT